MEEASKAFTLAVPNGPEGDFGYLSEQMLKEYLWPQAHSQLKEAWSAYIMKNFAESSAGPVLVHLQTPERYRCKVATSQGSPRGLAVVVPIENIKLVDTNQC